MLTGRRCSIYTGRPLPCATFPITVHGGPLRWQASLALSCPGLSWETLVGWAVSRRLPEGEGLEGELAKVRVNLRDRSTLSALRADALDRQRAARGAPELAGRIEQVRRRLRRERPTLRMAQWPGELPPAAGDGVELLPLAWERDGQVVALEHRRAGYRLLDLPPTGGPRPLGPLIPLPPRIPELSVAAEELLEGYLRYWTERDALFDHVLADPTLGLSTRALYDRIGQELSFIGATTVVRGMVRARFGQEQGSAVDLPAIVRGIQATDMDLLDRPGLGVRV